MIMNNFEYAFETIEIPDDDFAALLEKNRTDVYFVAAATVIALCNYRKDPEKCFRMLGFLKNPAEPVSVYEKQFLRDRLGGKEYKPFSYLKGSEPSNSYTPNEPYVVRVMSNPELSFIDDGWARIFLHSSGADFDREMKLRRKRSTGGWYLVEQMLLSDIREPMSEGGSSPADVWG